MTTGIAGPTHLAAEIEHAPVHAARIGRSFHHCSGDVLKPRIVSIVGHPGPLKDSVEDAYPVAVHHSLGLAINYDPQGPSNVLANPG